MLISKLCSITNEFSWIFMLLLSEWKSILLRVFLSISLSSIYLLYHQVIALSHRISSITHHKFSYFPVQSARNLQHRGLYAAQIVHISSIIDDDHPSKPVRLVYCVTNTSQVHYHSYEVIEVGEFITNVPIFFLRLLIFATFPLIKIQRLRLNAQNYWPFQD